MGLIGTVFRHNFIHLFTFWLTIDAYLAPMVIVLIFCFVFIKDAARLAHPTKQFTEVDQVAMN